MIDGRIEERNAKKRTAHAEHLSLPPRTTRKEEFDDILWSRQKRRRRRARRRRRIGVRFQEGDEVNNETRHIEHIEIRAASPADGRKNKTSAKDVQKKESRDVIDGRIEGRNVGATMRNIVHTTMKKNSVVLDVRRNTEQVTNEEAETTPGEAAQIDVERSRPNEALKRTKHGVGDYEDPKRTKR